MMAWCVALIAVAATGACLWWAARTYGRAVVGPVQLRIPGSGVKLGDEVAYELRLEPRRTVCFNAIRVVCVGYELSEWTETESSTDANGVSTSTSHTRRETHELYRVSHLLAESLEVETGKAFVRRGAFEIPDDAPPSMRAEAHAVVWEIRVLLDILSLPDIESVYDLTVRPVIVRA